MYPDFKELLCIFNAHNVKYLVVGGYAVSFHAQPRFTKDIDLLIHPAAGNAKAVFAALARFGAPMEGLTPGFFSQRGKFFRMGREPLAVDIPPEIAGVDFDRAWERRVEGVIDSVSGLTAHFILKTAVHPRQPRPAPMFTPPRAVLRNHPLGEVRSRCAAQWNWAFRAAPALSTAGFRFISCADLIVAKVAAGRPQDIADVAALRKAAASQGPPYRTDP